MKESLRKQAVAWVLFSHSSDAFVCLPVAISRRRLLYKLRISQNKMRRVCFSCLSVDRESRTWLCICHSLTLRLMPRTWCRRKRRAGLGGARWKPSRQRPPIRGKSSRYKTNTHKAQRVRSEGKKQREEKRDRIRENPGMEKRENERKRI